MSGAAIAATSPLPEAVDTAAVTVGVHADARSWDRFVATRSDAAGYHEWAWREVFVNAFGHEPVYLAARADDEVVGVLPLVVIESRLFGRSLTSLPFLNYGGIVADDDVVCAQLLEAAAEVARRRQCPHVELRHVNRRLPHLPVRQHKVTMLLPIESGMWERVDRKVRNQIRKAQKSHLVAFRGGAELLDEFYTVFARNMRDLGTPVYSRRLFEEVLRAFPDRTAIHVVRLDGRPVAAGLTFRTRGRVEVPWASSIRDFNPLCPNHLLYWSILESAVERGADTMDFGRSTPGEGTFRFKEQWGAQPVPLHWEYLLLQGHALPNVSPSNPKYRLMIETWKRLPLPVATALGPHIVRNIP
jgi:FemAB-related protein (PEP-CTERM system-associated)